jgi:hypothetical protein
VAGAVEASSEQVMPKSKVNAAGGRIGVKASRAMHHILRRIAKKRGLRRK